MNASVAVCIAAIPPRVATLLPRALASVCAQTRRPDEVHVAVDSKHEGVWATRQRALDAARTDFVAFLDDDDEFLPDHIELLMDCAELHGADYVYGFYEMVGHADEHILGPFPPPPDQVLDPTYPGFTTMPTVVVRTELAKAVGWTPPANLGALWAQEDRRFLRGCLAAGAKLARVNKRTRRYHWHGNNTAGMPWQWRKDWPAATAQEVTA